MQRKEWKQIVVLPFMLLQALTVTGTVIMNNKTCQNLQQPIYLEPGKLPSTALASFQGSGNTWVRQVLASATGYKTGDVYKSYGDDIYPEFSSVSDDTVIAIKTHTYSSSSTEDSGFKRALLIVRNPLDALYSEFNRMYGGNKTVYAKAEDLINIDRSLSWKWDTWMTHIASWVDFYTYWIKYFPGRTHVIYYNNLRLQPHTELLGAIRFLDLKPDILRLNCTIKFPKPAYFKRPDTPPPVDKHKLFKLSMSKSRKAVKILRDLIMDRFGEGSPIYKMFDLDISVKNLR